MKRILSALLILCLVFICVPASAGTYSSDISDVMYDYVMNNYSCKSAPQQQVNGAYRCVEMLEIIAKEVGGSSSDISDVMYDYVMNNYSCDSAAQQAVNGFYRAVEMLEIVAEILDSNGLRI